MSRRTTDVVGEHLERMRASKEALKVGLRLLQ
jgi:hypothetical protein